MKIFKENDPNYLDDRSPCWACIGQVAYNYDWKIYSCDEGRMLWRMSDDNFLMTPMLESWEETYKAMINSDTTKIMVQSSTLDWLPGYNESVYKPFIWVCPIHSYKTSWNLIPNFAKDHKKHIDFAVLDNIFLTGSKLPLEVNNLSPTLISFIFISLFVAIDNIGVQAQTICQTSAYFLTTTQEILEYIFELSAKTSELFRLQFVWEIWVSISFNLAFFCSFL